MASSKRATAVRARVLLAAGTSYSTRSRSTDRLTPSAAARQRPTAAFFSGGFGWAFFGAIAQSPNQGPAFRGPGQACWFQRAEEDQSVEPKAQKGLGRGPGERLG
jgi:hypothetical protein